MHNVIRSFVLVFLLTILIGDMAMAEKKIKGWTVC